MILLAVAVVLNKDSECAVDEIQEPLPDERECMTRLDFVVGDTVDNCSCLGLRTLQDFMLYSDYFCKARAWKTRPIEGLGSRQFNDPTATN